MKRWLNFKVTLISLLCISYGVHTLCDARTEAIPQWQLLWRKIISTIPGLNVNEPLSETQMESAYQALAPIINAEDQRQLDRAGVHLSYSVISKPSDLRLFLDWKRHSHGNPLVGVTFELEDAPRKTINYICTLANNGQFNSSSMESVVHLQLRLAEEDASLIDHILPQFTSLQSLELMESRIRSRGISSIAAHRNNLTELLHLDLRRSDFRCGALRDLARLLHSCPKLEYLTLSDNNLYCNNILELTTVMGTLRSLKHLDVALTHMDPPQIIAFAAAIVNLTSLERLDISLNSIELEGAVFLGRALVHYLSTAKCPSLRC